MTAVASVRERIRAELSRPPVSIADERKAWEASAERAPLPEGVSVQPSRAGVPSLLITPTRSQSGPLIIHLHGGGFYAGSSITHRGLGSHIALASQSQVLLPDYRLAPEYPFPAALENAVAAYRWALALGRKAHELILSGDLAGGYLARSTLLEIRRQQLPLPCSIILLSPWLDLTQSGESIRSLAALDPLVSKAALDEAARCFLGSRSVEDPAVALFDESPQKLPPMLIHAGAHEVLVSDAQRAARWAEATGAAVTLRIFPELWHVFHLWAPELPEANSAIEEIGRFVRRQLREYRRGSS
jgi:monoterpene epsilon-lactone hydrolase